MRILVTGANGQLGRDLMELLEKDSGFSALGTDRDTMDITDPKECAAVMEQFRPDAVLHAAAHTAVDKAESEPDEAFRINTLGSRNVSAAASRIGAKCCIVSTDYVFDGTAAKPYREYDRTNPLTVYGQTKLAGEQLAASLNNRWFIVRTAWLYGKHGSNFVKTMLKLGGERDSVSVVHDQLGCPTSSADLARFLLELVQTDCYGTYHAANSGYCTWYEFARAIYEEAGMKVDVRPCTTKEFPRPAPRPRYSVLDSMAMRTNGFEPLRHWREALKEYMT
jgi:dTDP-4-dehydrorhamnose reductase